MSLRIYLTKQAGNKFIYFLPYPLTKHFKKLLPNWCLIMQCAGNVNTGLSVQAFILREQQVHSWCLWHHWFCPSDRILCWEQDWQNEQGGWTWHKKLKLQLYPRHLLGWRHAPRAFWNGHLLCHQLGKIASANSSIAFSQAWRSDFLQFTQTLSESTGFFEKTLYRALWTTTL